MLERLLNSQNKGEESRKLIKNIFLGKINWKILGLDLVDITLFSLSMPLTQPRKRA
jgi:hypothetical protein